MPAGVTGIARPREWDATLGVELPELAGSGLDEVELTAFADEVVAVPPLGPEAETRMVGAVDGELPRPWAALLLRRGTTAWTIGARRTRAQLVRLPGLVRSTLEVAVAPDGTRSAAVDGELVAGLVEPAVDEAIRELERLGRLRFQAFAARADNLDGVRWQLSIDPL